MKASDFKGIIPPMMTAFTEEGEIYEEGTRRIVDSPCPGALPLRDLWQRADDVNRRAQKGS